MVRFGIYFRYSLFLLLLATAGCAHVSKWVSTFKAPESIGQFNFDWTIKGDKRVVPLQAFDDGRQTWLQFASNTPVPAVFAKRGEEEILLTYHQSGPYVILPGVWSHLMIQGGHVQGHVYRQTKSMDETKAKTSVTVAQTPVSIAKIPVSVTKIPVSVTKTPVADRKTPVAVRKIPVSVEKAVASVVSDVSVIPVKLSAGKEPAKAKAFKTFSVGPRDGTMRETLERWARQANWDFGSEHWAVDVDIPIVGSAQFDTSFEQAVRSLVASSELGDRPLQPCFYSNRVLRVVPFSQPCDRARTMTGAS